MSNSTIQHFVWLLVLTIASAAAVCLCQRHFAPLLQVNNRHQNSRNRDLLGPPAGNLYVGQFESAYARALHLPAPSAGNEHKRRQLSKRSRLAALSSTVNDEVIRQRRYLDQPQDRIESTFLDDQFDQLDLPSTSSARLLELAPAAAAHEEKQCSCEKSAHSSHSELPETRAQYGAEPATELPKEEAKVQLEAAQSPAYTPPGKVPLTQLTAVPSSGGESSSISFGQGEGKLSLPKLELPHAAEAEVQEEEEEPEDEVSVDLKEAKLPSSSANDGELMASSQRVRPSVESVDSPPPPPPAAASVQVDAPALTSAPTPTQSPKDSAAYGELAAVDVTVAPSSGHQYEHTTAEPKPEEPAKYEAKEEPAESAASISAHAPSAEVKVVEATLPADGAKEAEKIVVVEKGDGATKDAATLLSEAQQELADADKEVEAANETTAPEGEHKEPEPEAAAATTATAPPPPPPPPPAVELSSKNVANYEETAGKPTLEPKVEASCCSGHPPALTTSAPQPPAQLPPALPINSAPMAQVRWPPKSSPASCPEQVDHLTVALRELLALLEKLRARLRSDQSVEPEKRQSLLRRMRRLEVGAHSARHSARLRELPELNEKARRAGLESIRLAANPLVARHDSGLRQFVAKFRRLYGRYRRACRHQQHSSSKGE